MSIRHLTINRNTNFILTLICLALIALGISMFLVNLRIVGLLLVPLAFPPCCVGIKWTIFWHMGIRSERRRIDEQAGTLV